jgi:hypothetical protein
MAVSLQGRHNLTRKKAVKKPTMTDIKRVMSELGRRGGLASSAARTPEERSETARKAVTARWDRVRAGKA